MSSRAVIYARQSLDRSGEGAAVERQVTDCRELAQRRGWDVIDVISDNDMSASSGRRRPGYERLLDRARAGALDVIVVWAVDRLTRRLVDLEEVIAICEASGVRLATVTGDLDLSTDMGRMLARILASVARGEVERKGARQRRANEQRAEAGQMSWTRRPFGYDRVGDQVVIVKDEAEGLQRAAAMVLNGSTLAAAARQLDAQGLRTSLGGTWNVKTLRYVLLNPRYAGRVMHRGRDVGAGSWPVILDEATQAQLGDKLRDSRRRVQKSTELKHLLSGLARCGRCGSTMFASPAGVGQQRWMVYRCTSCYLMRRLASVDEVVESVVLARLAQPDAASLLAPDVDVDGLRAEVVDLRERRDVLAEMLADGSMTPAAVRPQATRLTERIRAVEDELARGAGDSPAAHLAAAGDIEQAWTELGVRARQAIIDLLATVTILPAGKGQRFDPSQVQIKWKLT